MTKYKYNDTISIKNAILTVKIVGIYPGGQQRQVHFKENSYAVIINDVPVDITESNLDMLVQAAKTLSNAVEAGEVSVADKVEVLDGDQKGVEGEVVKVEPKKRGRPAKK